VRVGSQIESSVDDPVGTLAEDGDELETAIVDGGPDEVAAGSDLGLGRHIRRGRTEVDRIGWKEGSFR
jgi:hypothetical protein